MTERGRAPGETIGFGPDHLPLGVFRRAGEQWRIGARLGDSILDLPAVLRDASFAVPSLNPFLALGPAAWSKSRERLRDAVERSGTASSGVALADAELRLPIEVPDYVDFYASEAHASNVGRIFRPDAPPLYPNWRHLPVGYHGRAGSVVVSGTEVVRPRGQRRGPRGNPVFGPTERLDIEAEVGFVVGAGADHPLSPAELGDHVFGVTLLNDWSARDIQSWEYVPLGPFLGKSFATSVSAWITPLAALDAARVPGAVQYPAPLPHLAEAGARGLDLRLAVELNGVVVSRPPYAGMYWSPGQMLAHLTSNGSRLRTGDLLGSGTVSGPDRTERGSLLELSWNGAEPFAVGAEERTFLLDGDTVRLTASAPGEDGGTVTLGVVEGTVRPAVQYE